MPSTPLGVGDIVHTSMRAFAARVGWDSYDVTDDEGAVAFEGVSRSDLDHMILLGVEVRRDNDGYCGPHQHCRHEVGRMVDGRVVWEDVC
jgi:hypothetical protein